MTIRTLPTTIISCIFEASQGIASRIFSCASTTFTVLRDEQRAWATFLNKNFFIRKIGCSASDSYGRLYNKIFNLFHKSLIELPNESGSNIATKTLEQNNTKWVEEYSLLNKNYFKSVDEATLLRIIYSQSLDDQSVISYLQEFSRGAGNESFGKAVQEWETAYVLGQRIEKYQKSQESMASFGRELSEKISNFSSSDQKLLLPLVTEKKADLEITFPSGVENIVKFFHHRASKEVYQSIKQELQTRLDTDWKNKLFTEIQEELRNLLLGQYSKVCQSSTLGASLSRFFPSTSEEERALVKEESLVEMIWDLLTQNGIQESVDTPLSIQKLNVIFDKEFALIHQGLDILVQTVGKGIEWCVRSGGELLSDSSFFLPWMQLWHSTLPQKHQGWIEVTNKRVDEVSSRESATYDITVFVREGIDKKYKTNINNFGEAFPFKKISYRVSANAMTPEFFSTLLSLTSPKEIENILLGHKKLEELIVPSVSNFSSNGLLDQIKMYYSQRKSPDGDSLEKIFFSIRFQALVSYWQSISRKNPEKDVTNITFLRSLNQIKTNITNLLSESRELHKKDVLSDKEHTHIIATGLQLQEYVITQEKKIEKQEKIVGEKILPPLVKSILKEAFHAAGISTTHLEHIKNFATAILGKEVEEEVALLCNELITERSFPPSYPNAPSFRELLRRIGVDLKNLSSDPTQSIKNIGIHTKNLRLSPLAIPLAALKIYINIHSLIKYSENILALFTFSSYLYFLGVLTNPLIGISMLAAAVGAEFACYSVKDVVKTTLLFHISIYQFIFFRLCIRLIQMADYFVQWTKLPEVEKARYFLKKELSNTVSFSTAEPILEGSIPKEIASLCRFYSQPIIQPSENPLEISTITLPSINMHFAVRNDNGVQRAYLEELPGFWLKEVTVDQDLQAMDFCHLLLENEKGEQKVSIIPNSQERLFFQKLLRMVGGYSSKIIEGVFTSLYSIGEIEEPSKEIIYYYDLIEGKLHSENPEAISYLVTHYITADNIAKGQEIVTELKRAKDKGENIDVLSILEKICTNTLPDLTNPFINKIVLQLCALCDEIPVQSKSFPLFIRAYEIYVNEKNQSQKAPSYLSDEEESKLLYHIQEDRGYVQATSSLYYFSTPLGQTALGLLNNVRDILFDEGDLAVSGKNAYIPDELKKYRIQKEYKDGETDEISLFLALMLKHASSPLFSLSKDFVNQVKSVRQFLVNDKKDQKTQQQLIVDLISLILSQPQKSNSNYWIDFLKYYTPYLLVGGGVAGGALLFQTLQSAIENQSDQEKKKLLLMVLGALPLLQLIIALSPAAIGLYKLLMPLYFSMSSTQVVNLYSLRRQDCYSETVDMETSTTYRKYNIYGAEYKEVDSPTEHYLLVQDNKGEYRRLSKEEELKAATLDAVHEFLKNLSWKLLVNPVYKTSTSIASLTTSLLSSDRVFNWLYEFTQLYPLSSLSKLAMKSTMQSVIDYKEITGQEKDTMQDVFPVLFPNLELQGSEYGHLQTLETNITSFYKKIAENFFEKRENRGIRSNDEEFQPNTSSLENLLQEIFTHSQENGGDMYGIKSLQNVENLKEVLTKTRNRLEEWRLEQRKTIEGLLRLPVTNLQSLTQKIDEHTSDINTARLQLQRTEALINVPTQESIISKINGLGRLFIKSIFSVKAPLGTTPRLVRLFEEKEELIQKIDSIKEEKRKLFNTSGDIFNARCSLGFEEIYQYFCQGKDNLILKALQIDNIQWQVLKNQLYRYMLLEKYISKATYMTSLCDEENVDISAKMNQIAHELHATIPSLELPRLEILVRGELQLEEKLGKSLLPAFRSAFRQKIDGFMLNFQRMHEFFKAMSSSVAA